MTCDAGRVSACIYLCMGQTLIAICCVMIAMSAMVCSTPNRPR